MSTQAEILNDQAPGPDLIDRIAEALPESVRQDYYREMVHLRFLPESDELLRILRAMQFLAVLMQQAPKEMAMQREQLGELLTSSLETMNDIRVAMIGYQNLLEPRLCKLPEEIAKAVNPDVIAGKLVESIRQRFVATGLPDTARDLHATAVLIKGSASELKQANTALIGSYEGAIVQTSRSLREVQSAFSNAASAARNSMDHVRASFLVEYKWSVAWLTGLALLLGCVLGVWVRIRLEPACPAPTVMQAPAQAPTPGEAQPSGNKQRNRSR